MVREIRALIIEDNPGDVCLIKEMLRTVHQTHFSVVSAGKFSDGCMYLESNPVDIILLDMGLPDVAGSTAIADLQQRYPALPVVVLTGMNNDTAALSAVRSGAEDYLVKGQVDTALLVRSIIYAIERRRAKCENTDLQRRLFQSERFASVGRLAAGVAHEINNPLTVILGNTQILLHRIDAMNPLHESLVMIEAASQRCRKIVYSLLAFARAENMEAKLFDINEVLDVSLALSRPQLEAAGVTIVRQPSSDLPDVQCVAPQLEQVFLNIISNARDAMPDGGTFTVGAGIIDKELHITFADTGTGIPSDIMGRIFDPFFTTKPVGQGTGLGLSVCIGIVEKHEGRILVSSPPGQGSTFTVVLPVKS